MKNIMNIFIGLVVVLAVAVISGTFYTVSEKEQVVITQFGKPIGKPVTKAGLHFKLPFVQNAQYFDKRLLEWDGDPNQIPTRDKRYIWVDVTARWKIYDALKFLQSVGSERGAHARLDDIINSATRDVISSHPLVETIRDSNRILDAGTVESVSPVADEALERITLGRNDIESEIIARAKELAPQYGIDLIDVRIKRVNYVEEVREKVYDRMISERKRAAEQYRSEGMGKSAEIKGRTEKELKQIKSKAYRTAQGIRGRADAEAISVYASSYSKDPDFYSFMRTLETYAATVGKGTTLILTTDSDYYKYLKQRK
ncbi:MAG: protease modulator HflC [Candidatus Omnitrophica bacterium]|nr:protease modulator HflC [Candidatus Omnitrophota bacterium]